VLRTELFIVSDLQILEIMMSTTDREQKLVDIAFSMAFTVLGNKEYFAKMTHSEVADWVAKQLRECGFPTTPMGASWGVLDSIK
jgi:hypothetical protein